jgi:hypothetical protein
VLKPRWSIIVAFLVLLAACQVQLVSQYDEQTDVAVTELQKRTERFLLELEALGGSDKPEAAARRTYAANEGFYRDAQVAITSMRLRAQAIPKNELTIQEIALLEQSFESLRQLHVQGGNAGLRTVIVEPVRSSLNTHFGAIIKLELSKKRGEP